MRGIVETVMDRTMAHTMSLKNFQMEIGYMIYMEVFPSGRRTITAVPFPKVLKTHIALRLLHLLPIESVEVVPGGIQLI